MEPTNELKLTQYSKGGGCGCKIAPSVLQEILQGGGDSAAFSNLVVGHASNDDAAAWQLDSGELVISTTDFFVPIVDDPFDFGRIASANAISDVYAMGGRPLMAIAILGWPIEKLPVSAAQQVLAGARAICAEAGIPLAGGHTIDSADPIFGLAVTGLASPQNLKRNNSAREGDLLFLTKPLGVGIFTTALKRGLLQPEHYAPLLAQMTRLNKVGSELGTLPAVHALTDVTGFGLLGHLLEMAEGSGLGAELNYSQLPKLEGLDTYLQQRTLPDATFRNWNSYNKDVQFEKGVNVLEAFNLLPDPQTNGGLLVAVAPDAADEVRTLLREAGCYAESIGKLTALGAKRLVVTV